MGIYEPVFLGCAFLTTLEFYKNVDYLKKRFSEVSIPLFKSDIVHS